MNEQEHPTGIYSPIENAVLSALNKPHNISVKKLCANLHEMTKKLRHYYNTANTANNPQPVDEWLCDNYYVLEKESKQSRKEIAVLSRRTNPEQIAQLYSVFENVLTKFRPAICDDTVVQILVAMQKVSPVDEGQFSFIPSAIKAVLVKIAYIACTKTKQAEEIAYAITSMNKLTSLDLQDIITQCSCVEKILSGDPSGVYSNMSEDTRGHYRYLVSRLAKKTKQSEEQTATQLITTAKDTNTHVGHGIINHPLLVNSNRCKGLTALLAGIFLPLCLALLAGRFTGNFWLVFLCYLPFWEILRTLITQVSLIGVDVSFIPRMDPTKLVQKPKTVVLVSTLLPKAADASSLSKRLEQLYFSNSDPDMYYCILADFKEWDYPTDEKDESQIKASSKVIKALNRKYGDKFMLFLRSRSYNRTQNKYSGWERKRGAITEFVRFLKGEKTSVHTFVGDKKILSEIRYIIALDSDTSLLYESAQTLVCVAMHPLNHPVIGECGTVTSGYGILTPRISTDLHSAKATAFSRVLSGCGGVTAYDTRDKDFYQDLFGESIFSGKGLIHVDAFYTILSNRFPENQVLSHDILEGAYLRAGFVSDVEMTDNAPTSLAAWLARLHRWLRGDWQNIKFISRQYSVDGKTYDNPISTLSKYKLFDNLRRSLTTISCFLCVVAAVLVEGNPRLILAFAGVFGVTFASIWAAIWSLLNGGILTLSRKFFTRTLPHTAELLAQALFHLIMLPTTAFSTADAVFRSLYRTYISRKKLLEWTTAAQSDGGSVSVLSVIKRFWLAQVAGILYLLLSLNSPVLAVLGIIFSLIIPVAYYSAKRSPEEKRTISAQDRDALLSYNAAMWQYYEDFADKKNNFLPPDNIQQSPVYRVANRTSPTNIGMMLLSTLAARDFDFIDTAGLFTRINRTMDTIEKLATWNGNLYNWYDTQTLETLKPDFVSTVDSGNYICCLVALKEGLCEFVAEKREIATLVTRIENIILQTDLKPFYDKKKNLFTIGYDPPTGELTTSHYDFLMSEARLTSYYAVAHKFVGKKHWGSLNRTMSRCDSFAGSVSWTGTMFEYFMPHLLLPIDEGSLLGEGMTYCLYCHKKRAREQNVPWGISESAFYAFDNNLNYQYKAHGVQKVGVKRYLDKELVISPYSTFLTISFNPNSAMANLSRLQTLGVYGQYGFFEAVDFTASRVGSGGLAVTRSYMAHHIGMSMVASCNALFTNRMQIRFMRDNHMKSAREFLQEKIAKSTVIYDQLKNTPASGDKHERPKLREQIGDICPTDPQCRLITNGEMTDILTDVGASYLKFGEIDLTRRSIDLLRKSSGILTLVRMDGKTTPAAKAPFYKSNVDYWVEQKEQCVTYYAKRPEMELGVRCMIHPTISCEQRQIVIKNTSNSKKLAQVLIYFEPILCSYNDYNAHLAYSKLFVTAKYDDTTKTITYSRRNKDSTENMFLTVGFLDETEFSFETKREKLMSSQNGVSDLLTYHSKTFSDKDGGSPDACCAIKLDMAVNAGSQRQVALLLCAARTQGQGIAGIVSMRKAGLLERKNAAKSTLLSDSLEGRLGCAILGQLLFTRASCTLNAVDKKSNTLGQSGLWTLGISGDLPIALIECSVELDCTTVECYMRLHAYLRSLHVEFDLCILYTGENMHQQLVAMVEKNSVKSILGNRCGIFLLEKQNIPAPVLTLLRAVSAHIFSRTLPALEKHASYTPVELRAVSPTVMPKDSALSVVGGSFCSGRFYVEKDSPLPFCHILASPVFGTLVSDSALGFTWALNSRENKLTPWYNDICTDNRGEMCLVYDGDSYFDLAKGARASFSTENAIYSASTSSFKSEMTVTVSPTGCAKYLDVTLQNTTNATHQFQCAYYIEPVLAVNRDTARHILFTQKGENVLEMHNPYNTAVMCHSAIALQTPFKEIAFATGRAQFLSGDWSENLDATNDPCAAIIVSVSLAAGESTSLRFALSYGRTAGSAVQMATTALAISEKAGGSITINTPNEHLNQLINNFAPHQMLACRMWGRTAFYQCGGAYGFRDQLQDSCAYLLLDPQQTKRQILRCCAVQFPQGDVLHWWHNLPKSGGGLKGVRTKFSDDLVWLPYAVSRYIKATGDRDILTTKVRYITGESLTNEIHERYLSPQKSEIIEDVFQHCCRALDRAYNVDERGLPLIGCGDWNDGFSSVGLEGKGTSVWLAMFMAKVSAGFSEVCALRGDTLLARKYSSNADALKAAVDAHCWDGNWYLRAFYDNGQPMGASGNSECEIDLLPQTFAVLCDMPDKDRVNSGMENAYNHLVNEKLQLVQLFNPPFATSDQQPGYIKAYPSGIRENGGQYSHSAVWFAMALIKQGKNDAAMHILDMLNPVQRNANPHLAQLYMLEPYYMAADIYTNKNAPARGGWSMYTGAISWYYHAIISCLLGIVQRGDCLTISPCLPSGWDNVTINLVMNGTPVDIEIVLGEFTQLLCDGVVVDCIPLDKTPHSVRVVVAS